MIETKVILCVLSANPGLHIVCKAPGKSQELVVFIVQTEIYAFAFVRVVFKESAAIVGDTPGMRACLSRHKK